jgi:hypothetical protein
MIREACITVLASCCILTIIPLDSVFVNKGPLAPLGLFIPLSFLLIALCYAVLEVKKLIANGERHLARGFVLSLIVGIVLSIIAVYFIGPYAMPKFRL